MPFHVRKSKLAEYNKAKADFTKVYTHPTSIPARSLYRSSSISIWILEGLSHSAKFFATEEFIESHTRNSIYFITLPWWHDQLYYETSISFIRLLAPNLDPKQIVVLGNAPEEVEFAVKAGMVNSFLCHHNCWLDYSYFTADSHAIKKYDLVLNTRPEIWKRPFLASCIPNLAIIKGNNYRKDDYYDLESLRPQYINKTRIAPHEVCGIINMSYAGGIFSELEGGCYSSSEYLLCGIPVVSTVSKGGRDIWFNSDNSIIIKEATPECVNEAVTAIKSSFSEGRYDAKKIRNDHILMQKSFVGKWKDFVANRFEASSVIVDVNSWFKEIYRHKMVNYQYCDLV